MITLYPAGNMALPNITADFSEVCLCNVSSRSTLEYLNNYWMDCYEIWLKHS